jgi:hypothetical protein
MYAKQLCQAGSVDRRGLPERTAVHTGKSHGRFGGVRFEPHALSLTAFELALTIEIIG